MLHPLWEILPDVQTESVTSYASKAHSPCTSVILCGIHLFVCLSLSLDSQHLHIVSLNNWLSNESTIKWEGLCEYHGIQGSISFVVQLLSCVIFVIPWTTAYQVSLALLSPRVCPNSCPLSQWFHPTISSSVTPPPPGLSLSQHQGLFQWVDSSVRWPKYWSFSFSINLSNEYSGLISFKMEWLDLLAVQGTLKSYPIP